MNYDLVWDNQPWDGEATHYNETNEIYCLLEEVDIYIWGIDEETGEHDWLYMPREDLTELDAFISMANVKQLVDMSKELEAVKALRDGLIKKLQNAQEDNLKAIAKERKRWAKQDLKAIAKRDLEQQIKALEEGAQYAISQYPNGAIHSLTERINQLKQQAEVNND